MRPCDVCSKELGEREGFLLRTEEVIASERYWDEAFSVLPIQSAEAKLLYVKQMAGQTDPWIICDTCIALFSVELKHARQNALRFYLSGGTFSPSSPGGIFNVCTTDPDLKSRTDLPEIKVCKGCGKSTLSAEANGLLDTCPHCGRGKWIKLVGQAAMCLAGMFISYVPFMHPEMFETAEWPWWVEVFSWGFGITSALGLVLVAVTTVIDWRSYTRG